MDTNIRRIINTSSQAYSMNKPMNKCTVNEAREIFKLSGKALAANHLINHGTPLGRAHNMVDQWEREHNQQIALANADFQLDACYSRLKQA